MAGLYRSAQFNTLEQCLRVTIFHSARFVTASARPGVTPEPTPAAGPSREQEEQNRDHRHAGG